MLTHSDGKWYDLNGVTKVYKSPEDSTGKSINVPKGRVFKGTVELTKKFNGKVPVNGKNEYGTPVTATFELYKGTSPGGTKIGTIYEIGPDGTIKVDKLLPGAYYFKETSADGYNLSSVIPFTIPTSSTETVKVEANNTEKPSSMTFTKTANPTTFNSLGQTITYTFTVTNTGETTLSNVLVHDDTLGKDVLLDKTTLLPEEIATGTLTYNITQADLDAGKFDNTAKATAKDSLGKTIEKTDKATVTGKDITSSITLTKDADKTSFDAKGQTITYTFVAKNTGKTTLTNVVVHDNNLNANVTLNKTTLLPNETATGTLTYTTTQADLDAGKFDNTAT